MTKDQVSVHFKLNAKKNLKTEGLCQAYLQGAEDCWDYIKENETNTYEKGLEDAWKVFSHVQSGELSFEEIRKIWDMDEVTFVNSFTEKYTPQEAVKILKEYEEKCITVGDVVTVDGGDLTFIYTKDNASGDYTKCHLLASDGSVWEDREKRGLKKTGKSIDISGILKEI